MIHQWEGCSLLPIAWNPLGGLLTGPGPWSIPVLPRESPREGRRGILLGLGTWTRYFGPPKSTEALGDTFLGLRGRGGRRGVGVGIRLAGGANDRQTWSGAIGFGFRFSCTGRCIGSC